MNHRFFIACFVGSLFVGMALPSGALASSRNGVAREYYSTGKLRLKVCYKNNELVYRRNYNNEGQLISDYRYKNGQLYYRRTSYLDGKIRSLWTKKSRILSTYFPDGKRKNTIVMDALREES